MEEENPFSCGEWTPKDRNYPPTAAMLPPVIAEDVHDYDMFPMPDCVTNAQEIVTSWHEDHRHLVAHAIAAQKKHKFGNPIDTLWNQWQYIESYGHIVEALVDIFVEALLKPYGILWQS